MEHNKVNDNNGALAFTGLLQQHDTANYSLANSSEVLHVNDGGFGFMPFPCMQIPFSPPWDDRNGACTAFPRDVRESCDYPMADLRMLNTLQNPQFDLNLTNTQTDKPLVTPTGTGNLNWNMRGISQSLNHDYMVNPGDMLNCCIDYNSFQNSPMNGYNVNLPNFGGSIAPIFEHTENREYTKMDNNNVKINSNQFEKIDGSFLSLGNGGNTESRSGCTFSGEAIASHLNPPHVQQTSRDFSISSLGQNLSSRVSNASSDLGGWASFNNDLGTIRDSNAWPSSNSLYNLQPPQVDMQHNMSMSSNINSGFISKMQEQDIFADLDFHNTFGDNQVASSGEFTLNNSNDLLCFGQVGLAPESVNATDRLQNCYMKPKCSSPESLAGSSLTGVTKWNHSGQLPSIHDGRAAPARSHLFPGRKGIQPNVGSIASQVSTATASLVPKRVIGSQVNGNGLHQPAFGIQGYSGMEVQAADKLGTSQQIASFQYPRNVVGSHTPIGRPRGTVPYQSPIDFRGLSSTNGQLQNATPSLLTPILPTTGQQVAYINKPTPATNITFGPSLKRGASRPPPTAPTARRSKPTLRPTPNPSVQQASLTTPVPVSTAAHIKWQAREEVSEPTKEKCLLCKRGLSYTPEGEMYQPATPPPVAVLSCGHTFHDHCLQLITPEDLSKDPPCIPCAIPEN